MAQVDDDGSGDVDFREFTEWFLRMEMDELQGLEDTLVDEELLEEAMVCTVAPALPLRRPRNRVEHLGCGLLLTDCVSMGASVAE